MFKGGLLSKITSANIGRYLNIPKSTLSRIMQRMESDGLLDRSDIYHLALTEKGSEIAEDLKMCYEGTLYFPEAIGEDSEETKKSAQKSALTGLKMKGRPFNLRYKYNDKYYPCMLDRTSLAGIFAAITVSLRAVFALSKKRKNHD